MYVTNYYIDTTPAATKHLKIEMSNGDNIFLITIEEEFNEPTMMASVVDSDRVFIEEPDVIFLEDGTIHLYAHSIPGHLVIKDINGDVRIFDHMNIEAL